MPDNSAATRDGLSRVLGPVDATCVVVGAIIGVGIFFTPGRVAQLAGSGSAALLAWCIGGVIALLGALTFAELGGLYPRTGGQYQILRDAYGHMPAFCFVVCNATAVQAAAIGIIGIVCIQNAALAVGGHLPGPIVLNAGVLSLILALTLANIVGVRWGARIQNWTVLVKLAALAVITLVAVLASTPTPGMPEAGGSPVGEPTQEMIFPVFAALVPALFSFGGWQHVLWVAGEVKLPRRNVPLATIGGVVVVIGAYVAVNWSYLHLLGFQRLAHSEAVAADAVAVVWPEFGKRLIAAAVALSAFGVLNAQLLSGPRLIYGLARDGRFFRSFAQAGARFKTPHPAILLLASVAVILLLVAGRDGIDKLLTGAVLIDGCFFALTGLAVIVLRRRRPEAERPIRVPFFPFVPLAFVLGEAAVIVGAYYDPAVRPAAYVALAWIAGAALVYLAFFRSGNMEMAT